MLYAVNVTKLNFRAGFGLRNVKQPLSLFIIIKELCHHLFSRTMEDNVARLDLPLKLCPAAIVWLMVHTKG